MSNTSYYLSVILSFLAAFQLLFVSLFLFVNKKGNKRGNRLLGLVFFLFSISLANITISVSGIKLPSDFIYLIDDGFFYLYGPLLYFYVQIIVYNDFKFRIIHGLHLIPYSIHLFYLFKVIFIFSPNDQRQLFEKIGAYDYPLQAYWFVGLIFIYLFCYLWFSHITIVTYRSVIKNKFSTIKGINLNWLSFIIQSFAFVTLFAMIHNMLPAMGSDSLNIASLILLLLFTFFFINRVLIKALNQPEIFSGIAQMELEKYSDSNLTEQEMNELSSKLKMSLKSDKHYLNPELTIKDLAERFDTTVKILSQVINQKFNMKFYDFINSYRCNEVKSILIDSDDKMTILEAMYASGFNSKSSFNKEFKKLTGQTPTEFKKSIGK